MKHILCRPNNINEVIDETISVLKSGGLVVFPSDTVYGLLVDTQQVEAVKKLISFKNRPPGKPISIFVENMDMMKDYVTVDSKQEKILNSILPGPFTVVLESKHKTSLLLESERGTLGVRYPYFALVNRLCKLFGKPVTATSANISGKHPHYQMNSLIDQLSDKKKHLIDLIVDAGKLPHNEPSTIIDLTHESVKILRKGDVILTSSETYISTSPAKTRKLAHHILSRYGKDRSKPLVFILKGDLGAGKTVFVKGVGEVFGITNIISPTYTISYEYDIDKVGKLVHYDLYNIQEEKELSFLGMNEAMKKGNVVCIEWGEKTGAIIEMLKQKGKIIVVDMKYKSKEEREIKIQTD